MIQWTNHVTMAWFIHYFLGRGLGAWITFSIDLSNLSLSLLLDSGSLSLGLLKILDNFFILNLLWSWKYIAFKLDNKNYLRFIKRLQKHNIIVTVWESAISKRVGIARRNIGVSLTAFDNFLYLQTEACNNLARSLDPKRRAIFEKSRNQLKIYERRTTGRLVAFHELEYPWRIVSSDTSIVLFLKWV